MQDLEEDPQFRELVNIYRDEAIGPALGEDYDELAIGMDEMLEDFDAMDLGGAAADFGAFGADPADADMAE
eukprot:m.98573 g.98573  ORF g.98573 m.98573 type:complete len:71 (+) comp8864_c0_seq2:1674-1886(+)